MHLPRSSRAKNVIRIWILFGVIAITTLWLYTLTERAPSNSSPNVIVSKEISNEENPPVIDIKPMEEEQKVPEKLQKPTTNASSKVITFYYPWYGNPEINGEWMHWNHQVLVNGTFTSRYPIQITCSLYRRDCIGYSVVTL
jgi:hypothetical protein